MSGSTPTSGAAERPLSDPPWVRWPVAALAAVSAGWMVFDGARALVVGDYVTGEGGRLGPWASLVSAAGVDPRAAGTKVFFVGYGVLWLAAVGGYLARRRWGRRAMVAGAAGSLWYLVVGAASSAVQLALLFVGHRRPRGRAGTYAARRSSTVRDAASSSDR